MARLLITIDGPAGAGKSTISKSLAHRIDYRYIDTGALYRGVAYTVQDRHLDFNDEEALTHLCAELDLRFVQDQAGLRLVANGADITNRIRTPQVTMLASAVSQKAVVRQFLLKIVRKIGMEKGVIFEGRDMGTVVFPNADLKFFLDADPAARALRRFKELPASSACTLEAVRDEMQRRDAQDFTRRLAPLRPAEDAIIIDSTHLSPEKVINLMATYINSSKIRPPK
jgi:cytidylate kinase